MTFYLTARVGNISEHTGRTKKNIVLDRSARIDRDVILHFYVRSNDDIVGDHGVLTKNATFPDYCTRTNVGKMPNFCTIADAYIVVDNGGGMNLEHDFLDYSDLIYLHNSMLIVTTETMI